MSVLLSTSCRSDVFLPDLLASEQGFYRPLRPFHVVTFCGATWDTAATAGVYWVIMLKRHSVYPSSWLTQDMTQVQLLFFVPFSPTFQSWAAVIAFSVKSSFCPRQRALVLQIHEGIISRVSSAAAGSALRRCTTPVSFERSSVTAAPASLLVCWSVFPCRGGNNYTRNDKHFFHFFSEHRHIA